MHTLILQRVVSINCLIARVSLIVFEYELQLVAVYTACSVYFIYCKLDSVLNAYAVLSGIACKGAASADNDCLFAFGYVC